MTEASSTAPSGLTGRPPIRHLYLHVPFCARICPYCAFYVHRGGAEAQRDFVRALIGEVGWARHEFDLQLETIYLGGGTPSLLAPEWIGELFAALPPACREITLEVNPATVTAAKAAAWKEAGINRISLGAQSFDAEYLKLLGRDHTPDEIGETVALLRAHGFANIGIDLMFALPHQPEAIWTETLRQAVALRPEHLSAYGLTYEEDTPFFERLQSGEWKTDEAREAAMFERTFTTLAEAGLPFYEVSNFARPGFESAHNRGYWEGRDYLGLGPSAYSTVGDLRWHNLRDTARYVEKIRGGESVIGERESVPPEVRRKERIMFGLRTREGVERETLLGCESAVAEAQENGLAEWHGDRLVLTRRGRLVADSVAALFV